jgi:hypothetical protein
MSNLGLIMDALNFASRAHKDQLRKKLQIEQAPHLTDRGKLVTPADEIANVCDVRQLPTANWSAQRRRDYADWAKRVVDGLRGIHLGLEAQFHPAFACVYRDTTEVSI